MQNMRISTLIKKRKLTNSVFDTKPKCMRSHDHQRDHTNHYWRFNRSHPYFTINVPTLNYKKCKINLIRIVFH